MCGIVGYVGDKNATEVLIEGLRRLEYRGYDSAGIAVRSDGHVVIKRNQGKLAELEKAIMKDPPAGIIGIGHTRWATHGRPSETNAHPHKAGNIVLVHNGIIENHAELRKVLSKRGHKFESETDTEIACHLIQGEFKKTGDLLKAMKASAEKIDGSYAFVILDETNDKEIFFAKRGSPLVIGIGDKEMVVASDIPPILPYTRKVVVLEDGEYGLITNKKLLLFDESGKEIKRTPRIITWDHVAAEKGGFKHFMLKEIFEQPKIIADTMAGRFISSNGGLSFPELKPVWGGANGKFPFSSIQIVACGTSWHAALVAKYWIEGLCRLPVSVDLASEFRYKNPIVSADNLVIAISQSGETADTLAAVKLAKSKGAKIVSICNVLDSSIPRASNATLYTHAGPEIGVASTKAFTAQLTMLLLFTIALAHRMKKVTRSFVDERIEEMLKLPGLLKAVLAEHEKVKDIAEKYVNASQVLFIGRGVEYPLVLEGALKLKEISYMHAEGFAAGELKHGPIALVEQGVPVIAIAAKDDTYEKVMSNIEEVQARGATVIALASKGDNEISKRVKEILRIPVASSFILPILHAIPLQLFAYYLADHKGTDVDQPRNLAKSVTVE